MTKCNRCDTLPRAEHVPHRPTWGPPPTDEGRSAPHRTAGTASHGSHRTAAPRSAPRSARTALREGRPRLRLRALPRGIPRAGRCSWRPCRGHHDNGVMDLPSLSPGDHLEARSKMCWIPEPFRSAARVSGSNSASRERKTRGREETASPLFCRGVHTPRLLRIPFCLISRLLILSLAAGGGGARPSGRQRGNPRRREGPQSQLRRAGAAMVSGCAGGNGTFLAQRAVSPSNARGIYITG